MSLKDKTIVVTGGSRGLGLGLVEALVDQGARVTVVARDEDALASVKQRLGVAVAPADVTDEGAAHRILAEVRPDVLVLNAGATRPMGRLDQLSWADFGSSGAAENGSPLSGGYAGAKRMLWFMAKYANGVARQKGLGIRFQAIVPQQIIGGTGVGDNASRVYAHAAGLDPEAFLSRFGAPLPPRRFGDHLVAVLDDPQYATGAAPLVSRAIRGLRFWREILLERRLIVAADRAPR